MNAIHMRSANTIQKDDVIKISNNIKVLSKEADITLNQAISIFDLTIKLKQLEAIESISGSIHEFKEQTLFGYNHITKG